MARLRIAWKKFGKDVKSFREERGFGLREAARVLRVTHSAWCRVEQGKPVEPATLLWIADWIGKDARLYLAPTFTRER